MVIMQSCFTQKKSFMAFSSSSLKTFDTGKQYVIKSASLRSSSSIAAQFTLVPGAKFNQPKSGTDSDLFIPVLQGAKKILPLYLAISGAGSNSANSFQWKTPFSIVIDTSGTRLQQCSMIQSKILPYVDIVSMTDPNTSFWYKMYWDSIPWCESDFIDPSNPCFAAFGANWESVAMTQGTNLTVNADTYFIAVEFLYLELQ